MVRKQQSSRSSRSSPRGTRSRRMSWDGVTPGQGMHFAHESVCPSRVHTEPDLSKSLSMIPMKVHSKRQGSHNSGPRSPVRSEGRSPVHSRSLQSADSSCTDCNPKADIDKDLAGVLGPCTVGSIPSQFSPESREPLITHLDCVLKAIRRDHAKSVDMIMDAIRTSEARICTRLRHLTDSNSDIPDMCSNTPASISPRSTGPMADRGHLEPNRKRPGNDSVTMTADLPGSAASGIGRGDLTRAISSESDEVAPEDVDTTKSSLSMPDLQGRPQEVRAEKTSRSPLTSPVLDSAAPLGFHELRSKPARQTRSSSKKARSRKVAPTKAPKQVGSPSLDSGNSAIPLDAKVSEIQKHMMDEMLKRELSPKTDDEVQDAMSYTSSPPCSQAPGDDDSDDPFTPKSNPESPFGRRNTLRKGSVCSVSLESLRQEQDSLLISPELSPTAGEPASVLERFGSEASISTNASVEEQWRKSREGHRSFFLVPWIIFRVCGIIPWRQHSVCANCYSFFMLLLGISATVYPVIQLAHDENVTMYMATLPFTVSGLLGALSLRKGFTSHLFAQFPGPLELYAFKHGFASEFIHGSLRQLMMLAFLLICVVAAQGAGFFFPLDNISWSIKTDPWTFLCSLVGSFLFIVLLYCQLHVICVLGMVVDHYCIELYPYPASCLSVLDWNTIQAMLRQIAGALDFCFMVCQTGACAALLLLATRILAVGHLDAAAGVYISCLLPPVLLALGAFLVFYKAASVSEKCTRVAPLVNSMTFDDSDDAFDSKRMQIVNFISSSSAGFYIQEVRVTASMAMKLLYVTALGASALVTKLATDNYRASP